MTGLGLLAVGGGAALGAWLRWWLGIVLNPLITESDALIRAFVFL